MIYRLFSNFDLFFTVTWLLLPTLSELPVQSYKRFFINGRLLQKKCDVGAIFFDFRPFVTLVTRHTKKKRKKKCAYIYILIIEHLVLYSRCAHTPGHAPPSCARPRALGHARALAPFSTFKFVCVTCDKCDNLGFSFSLRLAILSHASHFA